MVYKASGILNFAQAEFGTLALYIVWGLGTKGIGWLISAPIAIAIAVGVGLAFERFVLRTMGESAAVIRSVATAGLLLLLFAFELKVWRSAPRLIAVPLSGRGIIIGTTGLAPMHLLSIAVLIVLAVGLAVLVSKTRFGLGLLAVASDPSTARLMGVPFARVSAFTWALAGGLGAIAGLLIGPQHGAFAPLSLTASLFLPGMAAALIGGLRSLPGAFAGGMIAGVVEAFLRFTFPQTVGIAANGLLALIILVLLVRPQGLFGKTA